MDNELEAAFDRSFKYDFAGRLTYNEFGLTVDGQRQDITPYSQSISYDAFSQMTQRVAVLWGEENSFIRSYQNGRLTARPGEILTFDAAGNLIYQGTGGNKFQQTTHDAAGRRISFTERWVVNSPTTVVERVAAQTFDGGGETVKRVETLSRVGEPAVFTKTVYEVWSSVLGSTLTEIEMEGASEKRTTKVFAGGAVIAEQKSYPASPSSNAVVWIHADPLTGSKQEVAKSGAGAGREEYEPLGQKVRLTAPIVLDPPGSSPTPITNDGRFPEWQCVLPTELLLPTQCRLQIFVDGKFALGIWSEKKKGNISKIIDSPIPNLKLYSPSDEVASQVLTITSKEAKNTKSNETAVVKNVLAVVQSLPAIDEPIESNSAEYDSDFQTLIDKLDKRKDITYDDDKQSPETFADHCDRTVLEPLRKIGFDLKNFLSYLKKGANFYDGTTSKMNATTALGNNFRVPDPTYTVEEAYKFARNPVSKETLNVVTSYTLSKTKLTVFYNSTKSQSSVGLVFHEGLHGFGAFLNNGKPGAYSDDGLLNLFGLKGSSDLITKYIDDNCGDYFDNR